jgi:transposase
MAMAVTVRYLGIDVSRDWIEVCEGERLQRVANRAADLKRFFRQLTGPVEIAVESTHSYHQAVMVAALGCGHTVYLVDGYKLSRYREAVGVRAKTDVKDAQLLARYVASEGRHLVPYSLPPQAMQRLQQLLRARARLSKSKVALRQSLAGIGELGSTRAALVRRIAEAIHLIDRKIKRCLRESGYAAEAARCEAIPGIGALNAAALVATFHRGRFHSADAFIAFLGLDVRVRDSGRHRGRRKLTKRGNPEMRRLLFNAARAGARTSRWKSYYEQLRARGLSSTAACVALARKIARVAFAMLRDQTKYAAPAVCTVT